MLAFLTLLLLALLLCPILLVVASAFTTTQYMVFPPQGFTLRWFDEVLHSRDYIDAFLYSLGIAATTTIISTLLGGLVALALVRYRFPGRGAVNALVLSPLILPHVLIGVALLQWLSMLGLAVGSTSLIAAHVIVSMPYAVRLMAAGLTGFDTTLELAAQGLGAHPLVAFRRITLPLVGMAILGSAVLCFVVSFDNVTISIFLASPRNVTLPVRMYSRVEQGFGSSLAAASTLLLILAFALIVFTERLVSLRSLFLRN